MRILVLDEGVGSNPTSDKTIFSKHNQEMKKCLPAPGEARTHGLQIMRLTRCLLRYGGLVISVAQFGSSIGQLRHIPWLKNSALRQPGIEPGSTAWKAAMLTTIPLTLIVQNYNVLKRENHKYIFA